MITKQTEIFKTKVVLFKKNIFFYSNIYFQNKNKVLKKMIFDTITRECINQNASFQAETEF